jgi:predicted Zn-dependent protease
MQVFIRRPVLAAILAVLFLPGAVMAQAGPIPPAPAADAENRPPVPPGVPTSAHNCHLPTEGEVKLGREGSVEVEKEYKILRSGPYHERLQRVAREVVSASVRADIIGEYRRVYKMPRANDKARRVPFEFTFKVVDTEKEVNAFALPGGPVYVTTGLLDYATSDHELAAVLAHECAHVTFHHMEQLIRKQRKLRSAQIWGLLAAVIAGVAGGGAAASAAGNVLMGGQLVSIATLSGYGRELESEADRIAVLALKGTAYNPVGMVTFMQKLARDSRLRGNEELKLGIFQSHPYTNERVSAIMKQLEDLGYRVDPGYQRLVSRSFRVEAVPKRMDGQDVAELRLNGNLLVTLAAEEDELTPLQRGRRIAQQMEALFGDNVTFNDVKQSPDKTALLLKGVPVIVVYPEDAALAGGAEKATEQAYKEIIRALWKERLDKAQ